MCNKTEFSFDEKICDERAKILATMPYEEYYNIFEENGKVAFENTAEKMTTKAYIDSVRRYCKTMMLNKGKVTKKYKYSQKLTTNGRLFVSGFGVQNLEGNIRGYLCGKFYNDYDIKNCQPTILLYLLNKYYPEEKFPKLKKYVKDRDAFIKSVKKEKSKVKLDVIVSMNSSAKTKSKHFDLVMLDKEFKKAQNLFYTEENDFTRDLQCFKGINPKNPKGSFLNVCLSVMEKTILLKAVGLFDKKYVSTLMFDGFHMEKEVDSSDALEKLNKLTSEYGVEWDVKEPSTKLDYLDTKEFDEEDKSDFLTYESVKEEFEKQHFMIESPLNFGKEIVYRDDPIYTLYNKQDFGTLTTTYEYDELIVAKNGEVYCKRVKFLSKWLEDKSKRIYKKLDFIPREIECNETYNTFNGFVCQKPYEYTEKPEVIDLFKEHIKVLTDYDSKSEHYLLSYIADIFQNPDRNPEVAILFKSKQGYGKDTLVDIITAIMGQEYISRTDKIEEFLGQFNTSIKNKMILQINELEGKDGWDYRDKLKGLITAKTVIINEKCIRPYTQQYFSRLFIMSNRVNPIEIASDDRRFIVFKAHYKKPSESHFNALHDITKCKDSLYSLYNFFMNYKIDIHLARDRPLTSAYKNMKESNVNPLYQFLKEIVADERIDDYLEKEDGTFYKNKKSGDYLINCDEMLRAYREYLTQYNIDYKTNAKDMKKFLNEIDIQRERKCINNHRTYFYCVHTENLTAQLKSMNLCDDKSEELGNDWE